MAGFLNSRQFGFLNFLRNYAFKSDLKIKWVRPEKISCILPEKSGDVGIVPEIDKKQFMQKFQNSKELLAADDTVKALFTLENNKRVHISATYRDMLVKEVQRHKQDYGSMESKIAKMTGIIRRQQQVMAEFPRNKRLKVQLKELIDKRKKFLKYMRRWDYKKFEWLLEKLDLVYKSPPAEFHWITRKESLVKLTNLHCEQVKEDRLNEYRKYLESQQIDFLERKLKNLEFIRKEQIECLVEVTVSEKDISNCRAHLEKLKEKRPTETSS